MIKLRRICWKHTDKWAKKGNVNIELNDFINLFSKIAQITNQAKLRSFQYRIMHRAIILNDKLKM